MGKPKWDNGNFEFLLSKAMRNIQLYLRQAILLQESHFTSSKYLSDEVPLSFLEYIISKPVNNKWCTANLIGDFEGKRTHSTLSFQWLCQVPAMSLNFVTFLPFKVEDITQILPIPLKIHYSHGKFCCQNLWSKNFVNFEIIFINY